MAEPIRHAPRPLTREERATLEFLLHDAIPEVDVLRTQSAGTMVVSGCDCGCATIDLEVPPDAPLWEPNERVGRIAAKAFSHVGSPPHHGELLLHVLDGRLAELEIVDTDASGPLPQFPPVDSWQQPYAGEGPWEYSWPDDEPPPTDEPEQV